MKKVLKNHRGITIMALVITIIVLLILASVSIKIAIDGGLISVTQNAKDDNTIDSEKEAISLGYNAYKRIKERYKYFDGETSEQKNAVLEVEDAEKIDKVGNDWLITFKTKNEYELSQSGNIVLIRKAGELVAPWKDNGDGTFKKEYVILKVGDYINYDATKDENENTIIGEKATYISYSEANASADKNNGRSSGYSNDQVFNLSSYTAGWRVIGVKNGELQLISADIVSSESSQYYWLRGKNGYQYGPEELNAISAMYGRGKGATGAKSITIEDINKITGYDPTNTGDGKPFGTGNIQYGNKVTYFWDGTDKPYYEYGEGTNKKTGNLLDEHNIFNWYDGTQWQSSLKSTTASTTNREKIAELMNDYYSYYPTTLTAYENGILKGIKKESNEWKLLFENTSGNGKRYWLASTCTYCHPMADATFKIREVSIEKVNAATMLYLDGNVALRNSGIRPVVSLKSGIEIEKDEINDGSTLEKACKIK